MFHIAIIFKILPKGSHNKLSLYINKFILLFLTPFLSDSLKDFLILLPFSLFRFIIFPLRLFSLYYYHRALSYLAMRLLLNKTIVIGGKKFFCRNFNDLLHVVPYYENQILHWFKNTVDKGEVFIDIGAHIGRYTVLFAPFCKKVVSIEPDPYNFSILRRNVLLNGLDNVILFNCGCYSDGGEGFLYLSPFNYGGHSLKNDLIFDGKVRVRLKRLDDIIDEANIKYSDVGLIKIDVEGVEKEVLLGAHKILIMGKPKIIIESLNFHGVSKILSAYGYKLCDVDNFTKHNFLFNKM
jgi:FkbM family methyltransferase